MDGVHDMGGRSERFGPLPPRQADEPPFREPWQGRAFALALLANRAATSSNLHAFRHALERVPEPDYLASYYGRWAYAAELLLVESGLLAPGAVHARATGQTPEPPEPGEPEPGGPEPGEPEPGEPEPGEPRQRTMASGGPGNLRPVAAPPAYAVGDRVRARADASPGHTRLPGFARGRTGLVEAVLPGQVLPDSAAHLRGEDPEHTYRVAFASRELWGPGGEDFDLTVDLFESYLEAAP